MGKQCDFCFQFKDPLIAVLPSMPTRVCKACGYKIQQVIGFLQYHKGTFTYQPQLSNETPPAPPEKSSDRKSRAKQVDPDPNLS